MHTLISLALAALSVQGPPQEVPPQAGSAQDRPPVDGPKADEPKVDAPKVATRTAGAYPGLTLYAPLNLTETFLVDLDGQVVHRWKHEHSPGQACYLLEDGSLLRCARGGKNEVFQGGGEGGRIERWTWEGERIWAFELDDATMLHHHDVACLPNGNVLAIVWELRTEEQAFEAGRHVDALGSEGMWPDAILEIQPDGPTGGKIVWEWHAWDHLVQDVRKGRATYGDPRAFPGRIDLNLDVAAPQKSAEELEEEAKRLQALGYTGAPRGDSTQAPPQRGRKRADWLHGNAIDYDPATDLIVLSLREIGEVWVIDHSTTTAEARTDKGGKQGRGGELLWRWGNPANYRAGAAADRQLYGQHDARWLPGGRILVYDNGDQRPAGKFSRVLELEVPIDTAGRVAPLVPGRAASPAAAAWSYDGGEGNRFFSSHISGADRLPNGNTLICSGSEGRFFEVTRAGEVVWDLRLPAGGPGARRGPGQGPGQGRGPGDAPRPPGGDAAAPGQGPRRRDRGPTGGPGGGPGGFFRATRIGYEHPGLAGRVSAPKASDGE